MKFVEKISIFAIHLFCIIAIIELGVNYFSFQFLFPIKNATSYGYINKKTTQVVIPLDKYNSRYKAQLALPYELTKSIFIKQKDVIKSFDNITKKFGFKDKNNKFVIAPRFDIAEEFQNDYAIVALKIDNELKYGTIDKNGNWIIEPKYEHLCPFMKYYTKACIDEKHCGVIDKFGNEITLMSYNTDKIRHKNGNYSTQLCTIGEKNKVHCNYFL